MPLSCAAAPRVRSTCRPASPAASRARCGQDARWPSDDDQAAAAFHERLELGGDRVAERHVVEDHDARPVQRVVG